MGSFEREQGQHISGVSPRGKEKEIFGHRKRAALGVSVQVVGPIKELIISILSLSRKEY